MQISPLILTADEAKKVWLHAQKLDVKEAFGHGTAAVAAAIKHLGYVQIDTISVIERCHHHILFTRIPKYKKSELVQTLTQQKSIFEYWTHALAYIHTDDFRYFVSDMNKRRRSPGRWYETVTDSDIKKVMGLIKKTGAISIRDIQDDVLVEKDHEWASRKPSKRALQLGFNSGLLTVSERIGMLKKYELIERHFGWSKRPRAASLSEMNDYKLERALRSQGLINLDSACYLEAKNKAQLYKLIQKRLKSKELITVQVDSHDGHKYFAKAELADELKTIANTSNESLCHILSPFDPLIIQRKRLKQFFSYEHCFEAYIPKEKRVFGYFALPVLLNNEVVAVLDLKTNRAQKKLLLQKWTWLPKKRSSQSKMTIENELHRFEAFQLDR